MCSGSHQATVSGDIGEFRTVSRNTGNPFQRVIIQNQDHGGLIGHAVILAEDPETRCGNEAEGWVITGMARDNKDIEVRKFCSSDLRSLDA